MKFTKLKVRPRKEPVQAACAPELAQMLSCWATSQDYMNTSSCAATAQTLFDCMRTTPMRVKQHRPTINYHLARLNKNLK
ncbi:hypothetical protein C8Q75DRAFT_739644 [Abortiporus biennis]|nr:hypothetical protein C8Q75DRAFT_739644 [Abortiporus biennis]